MGIKTRSLKRAFWSFLLLLLSGLLCAVAVPFALMLTGVATGYITYADHSERMTKNIVPIIAATPDLQAVELPMNCKYLVLDKNYHVIEASLTGDDLRHALEYAFSGKQNANLNKQYILVSREKEFVVLQYYIGSQFINPWFYKHFPSPEILLALLIGINCIAVCSILTAKFAQNMRAELSPLFEATKQVTEQNLDFKVGHSKITEFQDVLISFSDMKDNLKTSLEQQWKAEALQRQQIAALAHDLKTPLTVIQGNIDLIHETELTEEQRVYASYITESAVKLGSYIKALIDISQTGYQLHLEDIDIAEYMSRLQVHAASLCCSKGISFSMEIDPELGVIKADNLLLERAIMNVVTNAADFSPAHGNIFMTVRKRNGFLEITVLDEGSGFSEEALRHAPEQFFMGDKSRSSDMHFGMGLYITAGILKKHHGELVLKNSETSHGAEVNMKIPYAEIHSRKRSLKP